MHDAEGGGGDAPADGVADDQHDGLPGGSDSGDSDSGGGHSGRQRDPYQDPLDPRGSMGMPKIVSRAANHLGRGQQGGGNVVVGVYVLSVLAIIIALGIFFIAGGH